MHLSPWFLSHLHSSEKQLITSFCLVYTPWRPPLRQRWSPHRTRPQQDLEGLSISFAWFACLLIEIIWLQDFINRYEILQGRSVEFIPGWDCHGLPIEMKVLQSMSSSERKQLTPLKMRETVWWVLYVISTPYSDRIHVIYVRQLSLPRKPWHPRRHPLRDTAYGQTGTPHTSHYNTSTKRLKLKSSVSVSFAAVGLFLFMHTSLVQVKCFCMVTFIEALNLFIGRLLRELR